MQGPVIPFVELDDDVFRVSSRIIEWMGYESYAAADKDAILDPDQRRESRFCIKFVSDYLISNRTTVFNSRLQGVPS